MIIRLTNLMDPAEGARIAGTLAADAAPDRKDLNSETAKRMGGNLRNAILLNAAFSVAAMPRDLTDFSIQRMMRGMTDELPIDHAVINTDAGGPIRADMWITIFLSPPEDYDGGELVINVSTGAQKLKMAAGDAVVYPANNFHFIEEVTRGERWVANAAIQSLIRDEEQRTVLTELWSVMDWVEKTTGDQAEKLVTSRQSLRRARANLYRMWAEV